MERIPEEPPKPKLQPPVDVERKGKEYLQSLIEPPKRAAVDYTKPRPIAKPEQSPEEQADKKLHQLAYYMSKVSGEKRSTFQILQELRRQAKEKFQKSN